jgi:hypothetical protein
MTKLVASTTIEQHRPPPCHCHRPPAATTPATAIVSNYWVSAGTNNHQFKLHRKKFKANNPRKKNQKPTVASFEHVQFKSENTTTATSIVYCRSGGFQLHGDTQIYP